MKRTKLHNSVTQKDSMSKKSSPNGAGERDQEQYPLLNASIGYRRFAWSSRSHKWDPFECGYTSGVSAKMLHPK